MTAVLLAHAGHDADGISAPAVLLLLALTLVLATPARRRR